MLAFVRNSPKCGQSTVLAEEGRLRKSIPEGIMRFTGGSDPSVDVSHRRILNSPGEIRGELVPRRYRDRDGDA